MARRGRRALILGATTVGLAVFVGIGIDLRPDSLVSDTDAVVILGGRADRIKPGVQLAAQLDVPLVLSSSAVLYAEREGIDCSPGILCIRPVPDSTAGEAVEVRSLARQRSWGHVTVVTSEFHAVRARLLFRQCFDADEIAVIGVPSDQTIDRWVISRIRERGAIIGAVTFARAC